MVAQALRHFLVVGLGFGLAVGWILTALINTLIGYALEAALRRPADEPYWGALLLTVTSMAAITLATVLGTRLFRRRVLPGGISTDALALSSLLYIGMVLLFVAPQLADILQRIYTHMSFAYRIPASTLLMISLPLLRLIAIPLSYAWVGRAALAHEPEQDQITRAA